LEVLLVNFKILFLPNSKKPVDKYPWAFFLLNNHPEIR